MCRTSPLVQCVVLIPALLVATAAVMATRTAIVVAIRAGLGVGAGDTRIRVAIRRANTTDGARPCERRDTVARARRYGEDVPLLPIAARRGLGRDRLRPHGAILLQPVVRLAMLEEAALPPGDRNRQNVGAVIRQTAGDGPYACEIMQCNASTAKSTAIQLSLIVLDLLRITFKMIRYTCVY